MSFEIKPTKEFSKDFSKLIKADKKRIKSKVEEVAEAPNRYKHLHYDLQGSCRIRIGKLRVVYSYSIELKEMYLEKIVFRHDY